MQFLRSHAYPLDPIRRPTIIGRASRPRRYRVTIRHVFTSLADGRRVYPMIPAEAAPDLLYLPLLKR